MPATSVTELLFEAKPRWSGTIGAGGVAASNTTTIPLSSAANLDNGDAYIFVINRVTSAGVKNELSEMETVIGELSGTNFVNCVRGQEGTAQAWEAGLVVEILFTASHWNKLIEWAESEHNADGTHSDITADSVTSGTIEATTSADLKTLAIDGGTAMTAVKDEDDMSSNSATALATQQSIKAYVDSRPQTEVFIIPGTFPSAATTNLSKTWFAPADLTISTVSLYVDTAGSGTGSTVVDINLAGTTIMATTKLVLTTTETSEVDVTPSTTAVTKGQAITIDVDSVTGTTAPSNGYVLINYTRD